MAEDKIHGLVGKITAGSDKAWWGHEHVERILRERFDNWERNRIRLEKQLAEARAQVGDYSGMIDEAHAELTKIGIPSTESDGMGGTVWLSLESRAKLARAEGMREAARIARKFKPKYICYTQCGEAIAAAIERAAEAKGKEVPTATPDGLSMRPMPVTSVPATGATSELEASAGVAQRPKIVCLCGSTRFYKEFQIANFQETMNGRIVLSVGFYAHAQGHEWHVAEHGQHVGINDEEKCKLDELHKRKIDLADEVYVLNVGGYIGSSTRSEIDYALAHDKPVRYLEGAHAERGRMEK